MTRENNALLVAGHDAIVAQCTPQGSGALSLVRICGDSAVEVADKLAKLSSGKKLVDCQSHTIHHGHVVNRKNAPADVVDEVLFFLMLSPKTFTGQDTVEITTHNNQFIVQKIIELAVQAGARVAEPGEFTRRAFLHGKIDLVQAESINDLIHAQTQHALEKSMQQLKGSLSSFCAQIEQGIFQILTLVEASFEFLDEEQRDFDFDELVEEKLTLLLEQIKAVQANNNAVQLIKQGVRIALLGSVNAGKSTLFNRLLNKQRAIVTDIAGTTRDSIEANLYKNGNFLMLVDTAGLRQTDDVVEKEGIIRSREQAAHADIVLLVCDSSKPLSQEQQDDYQGVISQYADKVIVVFNKIDIGSKDFAQQYTFFKDIPAVFVSAQEGDGIVELEVRLDDTIKKLFSTYNSPFLLNKRHIDVITEIQNKLELLASNQHQRVHYELMAHHLKQLLEHVAQLTGKNISERMMDMVFGQFCVGK
ncbi:MAG: tRNA uridine-5-carboxymethylaminomethyl(34) synthesis GTPase MnmE [Epsilonproteobacteria bacterium]|nr:tRNA uridine-5-carboxymethylaminomethyl(34) synthesis GTPase MnmE [Campylobacterota bacterium]